MRDFGPAALDDLIPRIRVIAATLDAAHAAGVVHGALHPSKVIITDAGTSLIAGTSSSLPYVAPEVADGDAATPKSDQYALAAIAYEWLFGRPVARPVEVRSMPGVDRAALSKAFTGALSTRPGDRFDSCSEFAQRLADAEVPELPLLALEPETATIDVEPVELAAIEPFVPEELAPYSALPEAAVPAPAFASTSRTSEPARFSGTALILAAIVGSIVGFAAGYMALPRALQSNPPQTFATAPATESVVELAPKTAPTAPAPKAAQAPKGIEAPAAAPGRLLIRSNPAGAEVSVDGVSRGVTPLALRDLELGTRTVTLTRRGFESQTRTVAITAERPSRTLDVRMAAETVPAKPAAATGVLVIESRPTGAAVSVNGRSRGVTPLTLPALAPGDYRIVLSMPGFQNFATTARVVAGERVRAAASLTALEQE